MPSRLISHLYHDDEKRDIGRERAFTAESAHVGASPRPLAWRDDVDSENDCKGGVMANCENHNKSGAAVSITIWVAGTGRDQAQQRQKAVEAHMSGLSAACVGGGLGRFFYDLWSTERGVDPLATEGDWISDAQFELPTPSPSAGDLADLTHSIEAYLKESLDFPVTVDVNLA
jgi:hypothetical protein